MAEDSAAGRARFLSLRGWQLGLLVVVLLALGLVWLRYGIFATGALWDRGAATKRSRVALEKTMDDCAWRLAEIARTLAMATQWDRDSDPVGYRRLREERDRLRANIARARAELAEL